MQQGGLFNDWDTGRESARIHVHPKEGGLLAGGGNTRSPAQDRKKGPHKLVEREGGRRGESKLKRRGVGRPGKEKTVGIFVAEATKREKKKRIFVGVQKTNSKEATSPQGGNHTWDTCGGQGGGEERRSNKGSRWGGASEPSGRGEREGSSLERGKEGGALSVAAEEKRKRNGTGSFFRSSMGRGGGPGKSLLFGGGGRKKVASRKGLDREGDFLLYRTTPNRDRLEK